MSALPLFACHTVWSAAAQVPLSGDVPVGLHGGPLLGVALKRMTSSGAELSGEEASPVLQFYSWNGVTKVSSPTLKWVTKLGACRWKASLCVAPLNRAVQGAWAFAMPCQ